MERVSCPSPESNFGSSAVQNIIQSLHRQSYPWSYFGSAKGKSKGKSHPIAGHEGTERQYSYSSTLSLTLTLDEDGRLTPFPGLFTLKNISVTDRLRDAGWDAGAVWTFSGKLDPTGMWSPDRPACSEQLYRLCWPGPPLILVHCINKIHYCWTKLKVSSFHNSNRNEKIRFLGYCLNCTGLAKIVAWGWIKILLPVYQYLKP